MRLASWTRLFDLGPIPMIGNLNNGALAGLTPEGAELCRRMMREGVSEDDIPDSCKELVELLSTACFFEGSSCDSDGIYTAYLHVTQRCNLNCTGCYSRSALRNTLDDPTTEQLRHAIAELAKGGTQRLIISGGEPFLRDDLSALAAYAKMLGIAFVAILTNGTITDDAVLAKLSSSVDVISVSFDGSTSSAVPHVRHEQLFSVLVDTVKQIQHAGIAAHILPTLHSLNIDEIPEYGKLAQKLGCSLSFSMLPGLADKLGELALNDEQLTRLGHMAARSEVGLDNDASFDVTAGLQAKKNCGAGVTEVSVDADGSVYPCHMLQFPEFRMGNLFSGTLEDALASRVAKQFAALHVDNLAGCSECARRHLCGGGCRAEAYYAKDLLSVPHSSCVLNQNYFDEIEKQVVQQFH